MSLDSKNASQTKEATRGSAVTHVAFRWTVPSDLLEDAGGNLIDAAFDAVHKVLQQVVISKCERFIYQFEVTDPQREDEEERAEARALAGPLIDMRPNGKNWHFQVREDGLARATHGST